MIIDFAIYRLDFRCIRVWIVRHPSFDARRDAESRDIPHNIAIAIAQKYQIAQFVPSFLPFIGEIYFVTNRRGVYVKTCARFSYNEIIDKRAFIIKASRIYIRLSRVLFPFRRAS